MLSTNAQHAKTVHPRILITHNVFVHTMLYIITLSTNVKEVAQRIKQFFQMDHVRHVQVTLHHIIIAATVMMAMLFTPM